MTEKNGKAKTKRSGAKAGADPAKSVMGNLSSTRPARMGRHREGAPDGPGATATHSPPKPRAAPKKAAAAKPRAASKPARPRAAATTARASDGPRAVRSGSPSLERPAPRSRARQPPPSGPPKGTELVTTAVQAAGELAQIGISAYGRMVKRAVNRLPKP